MWCLKPGLLQVTTKQVPTRVIHENWFGFGAVNKFSCNFACAFYFHTSISHGDVTFLGFKFVWKCHKLDSLQLRKEIYLFINGKYSTAVSHYF